MYEVHVTSNAKRGPSPLFSYFLFLFLCQCIHPVYPFQRTRAHPAIDFHKIRELLQRRENFERKKDDFLEDYACAKDDQSG